MPHFRVYMIGPDDHIQNGRDVECADDEEAGQIALQVAGRSCGAEVWQGTRLVHRIPVQAQATGCTAA